MAADSKTAIESKYTSWERERLLEALDAHQRGLTEPPLIRKWNQVEGLYQDSGRAENADTTMEK